MASCSLLYDCPACQVSTRALVTGLREPTASISPRSQATLRELRDLKESLGAPREEDPVGSLAGDILNMAARLELRYATCPRCGARNPEGLEHQVTERRRTRILGTLVSVLLAGGVWCFPVLAFAIPALAAFQTVGMALFARRLTTPFPWLVFLGNLAMTIVFMVAATLVPRATAALPLLLGLRFLFYRPKDEEAPWKGAAESIRFES